MQPVKVGSLSSLYQSVENLNQVCLKSDTCKDMLLQPRNSMEACCKDLKLNIDDTEPTKYFLCSNLSQCFRDGPVLLSAFKNKKCHCGRFLDKPISPQNSPTFCGFVESNATYLITDELNVVPNSFDIIFHLFKNYGIENMSQVNEMTVNVTKNEVVDLLKCCLLSKTTMTDCFLEKKFLSKSFEQRELSLHDFEGNDSGIQINVKLLQRKSNGKIVFAQGEEDFADFLLSFLTFPLGGVVRLMKGYSSMGSIDLLYKSIVDFVDHYWMSKEVKDKLVDPGLAPQFKLSNQLLPFYEFSAPRNFCFSEQSFNSTAMKCIISDSYLTEISNRDTHYSNIRKASSVMVDPMSDVGSHRGYAKGPAMYVATDELVVEPMSSTFLVSLLNSMSIPFSDLEQKVVSIGIKEGVSILKASLTSTSALTTGLGHLLTKVKEES